MEAQAIKEWTVIKLHNRTSFQTAGIINKLLILTRVALIQIRINQVRIQLLLPRIPNKTNHKLLTQAQALATLKIKHLRQALATLKIKHLRPQTTQILHIVLVLHLMSQTLTLVIAGNHL